MGFQNSNTEHCYICNTKVSITVDNSIASHYQLHQEELERIRFSNSTKDVVRTPCLMCNPPNSFPVSRMRMHTRSAHGIHVSEYKKKFNITSDKDYDLVELILHECGICGLYLLLDSDVIAVHIKRHKITHANYNAKFMSLVGKPAAESKKEGKMGKKFQEKALLIEPVAPLTTSVSVPFNPSMLIANSEELELNLKINSGASDDKTPSENSLMSFLQTDESSFSMARDVGTDETFDEIPEIKNDLVAPSLDENSDEFSERSNFDFRSNTDNSSNFQNRKRPMKNSDTSDNFREQIKMKFTRIENQKNIIRAAFGNLVDEDDFSEDEENSSGEDLIHETKNSNIRILENTDEFSDLLYRINGNFASESNRVLPEQSSIKSDQSLDDLIANIWD